MRRLVLIGLMAVVSVCIYASVNFISSCGKATVTVGPDYFGDTQEAIDYYMELDKILCDS